MKGLGKLLMLLGLLVVVIGLFGAAFFADPARIDGIMHGLRGLNNIFNMEGLRSFLSGLSGAIKAGRVKLLAGGGIGFLVGWILSR